MSCRPLAQDYGGGGPLAFSSPAVHPARHLESKFRTLEPLRCDHETAASPRPSRTEPRPPSARPSAAPRLPAGGVVRGGRPAGRHRVGVHRGPDAEPARPRRRRVLLAQGLRLRLDRVRVQLDVLQRAARRHGRGQRQRPRVHQQQGGAALPTPGAAVQAGRQRRRPDFDGGPQDHLPEDPWLRRGLHRRRRRDDPVVAGGGAGPAPQVVLLRGRAGVQHGEVAHRRLRLLQPAVLLRRRQRRGHHARTLQPAEGGPHLQDPNGEEGQGADARDVRRPAHLQHGVVAARLDEDQQQVLRLRLPQEGALPDVRRLLRQVPRGLRRGGRRHPRRVHGQRAPQRRRPVQALQLAGLDARDDARVDPRPLRAHHPGLQVQGRQDRGPRRPEDLPALDDGAGARRQQDCRLHRHHRLPLVPQLHHARGAPGRRAQGLPRQAAHQHRGLQWRQAVGLHPGAAGVLDQGRVLPRRHRWRDEPLDGRLDRLEPGAEPAGRPHLGQELGGRADHRGRQQGRVLPQPDVLRAGARLQVRAEGLGARRAAPQRRRPAGGQGGQHRLRAAGRRAGRRTHQQAQQRAQRQHPGRRPRPGRRARPRQVLRHGHLLVAAPPASPPSTTACPRPRPGRPGPRRQPESVQTRPSGSSSPSCAVPLNIETFPKPK